MTATPTTTDSSETRCDADPSNVLGDVFGDGVLRIVRRVIARRVDASSVDDVVQETAMAITRSPNVPGDPDRRRHLVVAVAIRQSALWVRTQIRHRRRIDACIDTWSTRQPDVDCDAADPALWMLRQESHASLRDAMDRLPAEQRRWLSMKFVDGMTYSEIAEAAGISRHAAEYRVGVARQRLKRELS